MEGMRKHNLVCVLEFDERNSGVIFHGKVTMDNDNP